MIGNWATKISIKTKPIVRTPATTNREMTMAESQA